MSTTIPSTGSGKSIYLDASSNRTNSSRIVSSQDPDYVPIQYTHDSGVQYGILASYGNDARSKNPFSNQSALFTICTAEVGPTVESEDAASSLDKGSQSGSPNCVFKATDTEHPGTPTQSENSSQHADSFGEGTMIATSKRDEVLQTSNGARSSPADLITKKSSFTNRDGLPMSSGIFINGVGTVGPHASTEPSDDLQRRARDANFTLTQKQKSKIIKAEAKDSQRLSKIIKEEAKVEKKALDLAINELADLQRFQKQAVKDEAKSHANHLKTLGALKKQESAYLTSKTRYESLQGQLGAESERLEVVREGARVATERVAEKSQEVDALRKMFGVDEREREVKLGQLKETSTSMLWKI